MDYGFISSQRIKECRKDIGLTQRQLAERAGYVKSTIANIEQGKTNPSLELLCAICSALNIHPSTLFISNIYYIKALGAHTRPILPTMLSIGDSGIFYFNNLGFQFSVLNRNDMRFLLNVMTMRHNSPFNVKQ